MTPERFSKLRRVLARRQPDLTVLADGVRKPHNVSAILRTCDAVGIYRLHASAEGGELRRHHNMAGGAKRWVELEIHASTAAGLEALRHDGWRIAVAHAAGSGARDFRSIDYTQRLAIVLGAELSGPSAATLEQADIAIEVPMQGMAESLNVSVAAAVILFEAQRQREAAGLYDESRLTPEAFDRTLFEWAHPELARHCRELGRPYPPLAEDGSLPRNPLGQQRTQAN
jgi:tRNA (guanosine-2'-O-)-methyltransferase